MKLLFALLCCCFALAASAEPRKVQVFVGLCDNKTQGIVPVGEKIGNGDDPEANLYWGCSDGLGSYFKRSAHWKIVASEKDVSPVILRRLRLRHESGNIEMTVDAYRGSELRQCLNDFEAAAAAKKYDLVAYIGHNGLMDFELPPLEPAPGNHTQVAVLCCLSDKYFSRRLGRLGCKPILMTQQLMYPGSFLLHAALETWLRDGSLSEIRAAAGAAYAQNQKISTRAATGVFAPLVE